MFEYGFVLDIFVGSRAAGRRRVIASAFSVVRFLTRCDIDQFIVVQIGLLRFYGMYWCLITVSFGLIYKHIHNSNRLIMNALLAKLFSYSSIQVFNENVQVTNLLLLIRGQT